MPVTNDILLDEATQIIAISGFSTPGYLIPSQPLSIENPGRLPLSRGFLRQFKKRNKIRTVKR